MTTFKNCVSFFVLKALPFALGIGTLVVFAFMFMAVVSSII